MNYDEQFDLTKAISYLKEGYYVKNIDWPDTKYVYMEDGFLYDQDDEEMSWEWLQKNKRLVFEFIEDDKEEECLTQGIEEKTEEFGITEDGEPVNKLKTESEGKKNINQVLNIKNGEENTKENVTTKITSKNLSGSGAIIKNINPSETLNERNGMNEIETEKTNVSENITEKIGNKSLSKSVKEENLMIQQGDYTVYSKALDEEKSGSIELLNNSANHLVDLAKELTKKNSDNFTLDVAIRALAESRQQMKTKLDYLKFGKEMIDGK